MLYLILGTVGYLAGAMSFLKAWCRVGKLQHFENVDLVYKGYNYLSRTLDGYYVDGWECTNVKLTKDNCAWYSLTEAKIISLLLWAPLSVMIGSKWIVLGLWYSISHGIDHLILPRPTKPDPVKLEKKDTYQIQAETEVERLLSN